MRVIVAGALANKADQGGEAWVRLAWILGLQELGCEVHFAEEGGLDGRPYFEKVAAQFGFAATLIGSHDTARLESFARGADLLVNISGHLTYAPVFEQVARRIYVDIDPGHTQFWHSQGHDAARLDGHDIFFSVGENIGGQIPDCRREWHSLRPPVVLSRWLVSETKARTFTTIANWRSSVGGSGFPEKVHEFRKVIDLPRRTGARFVAALNIHPAETRDLAALHECGWELRNPAEVSTPDAYCEFLRGSGAEFSVAQGIYTRTRSGWVSDRTAHYLACGRPAIVQETGTSLPAGEGFLTFTTIDEASACVADVLANYSRHASAARALAEAHMDSRKVLTQFIETSTKSTYAH